MSLLHKRNTIPQTHLRQGRDQTSSSKDRSHQDYAPTSEPETVSCLPWISGILQKIHQELRENSKTINNVNTYGHQIRMEGHTSGRFHET